MSAVDTDATTRYYRYTRRRAVSEMPGDNDSGHQQHRWGLFSALSSFRRSYNPRYRGTSSNSTSACATSAGVHKRGRGKGATVVDHDERKASEERTEDWCGARKKEKKINGNSDRDKSSWRYTKDGVGECTESSKRVGRRMQKKRVSFLLRRKSKKSNRDGGEKGKDSRYDKGSFVGSGHHEEEEGDDDDDNNDTMKEEEKKKILKLRRALSLHEPPVGIDTKSDIASDSSGSDGTTVEIKAKVNEETFEKLHKFARTASMYSTTDSGTAEKGGDTERKNASDDETETSDEIIGEIRLEDFADQDSDYEFMDTQSILSGINTGQQDLGTFKRDGASGEPHSLTWIGNEKELQALFAEAGIIDDLEIENVKEVSLEEFQVSDEQLAEWEAISKEHNDRCTAWTHEGTGDEENSDHGIEALDIRSLANEFAQLHKCSLESNE